MGLNLLVDSSSLQPCQADNTTTFGTNVFPSIYYNSDGMFADILMHASGFWNNSTSLSLSATGYPTTPGVQALSIVDFDGYPSGNYQFYGEGAFTFSFLNGGTTSFVVPGSTQKVGNITTATISVANAPPYPDVLAGNATGASIQLALAVTCTDANNPPNNLHLICPGYPAYPNNPEFRTEYLKALAPFKCLRFMDWMQTIGSTVTTWASRPNPNPYYGSQQMAYETFIDLVNALNNNCDIWFCIPLYATADWDQGMAQMLKTRLNPGHIAYYEVSNELWNAGPGFYPDWNQVEQWGASNPALQPSIGGWGQHGREMAFLLMQHLSVMQPILGSMGRPIFAAQSSSPTYWSAGLDWINTTYGPPSNYIFGIAGSIYPSINPGDNPQDLTSLFASMTTNLTVGWLQLLQQNVALANQYNLKYLVYECGQTLSGLNYTLNNGSLDPVTYPLYESAQYDPRMGTWYQALGNMLKSNGVYLANFYAFGCSHDGGPGFWSALPDIRYATTPSSVPKYAAQLVLAGPPNVSSTVGSGSTGGSSSGGNSKNAAYNAWYAQWAAAHQKEINWAAQQAAKNAAKAAAQAKKK